MREVYQEAVMEILEFAVDNRINTGLIGGNESSDIGTLDNMGQLSSW